MGGCFRRNVAVHDPSPIIQNPAFIQQAAILKPYLLN